MKRSTILSILVPLAMVLVILPASLGAEGPVPQYDVWQYGPDTAFTWYRHDCAYFDSGGGQAYDQKVYCLGGRPGQTHEPDVWQFDPVTSAWMDTGADMPVHASNYTASVLTDTNGIGIYMVAGYLVASDTQTDTVQVYYPDSNTAVVIDTDPLPAIVPGGTEPPIAGGQEVVDGLLYYFGGWNSNAPPAYTSVETWVYDPFAPAGSRWSQLADMNLGRGYIISAQVDGKIYAIGGDIYDGANLIAQTIVERYDPATDTWDDAGVADMPVACDEARAIGFDSDSPFEFRGQLVTMGCGQWTAQIPECMLYDVANDLWDQSFPDLNNQRRNHGGTFIPDLGVAGTPGMWVFGGLDGAPLQSTEYYEVELFVPVVELIPEYQEAAAYPGDTVDYLAYVRNEMGVEDTFDLDYGGNLWPESGPATVGPIANGELMSFTVSVSIPMDALYGISDALSITVTAQSSPTYSDTAWIRTKTIATVDGHIYDANTGDPLAGYVYVYDANDPDVEFEAFADANGYYVIVDEAFVLRSYEIYGTMIGWERVDDTLTLTGLQTTTLDFYLPAPVMGWEPNVIDVTLPESATLDVTLLISNTGTDDLLYRIDEIAPGSGFSPTMGVESLPDGVDPQVYADLANSPDGTAEILVVMAEQADLSAAYSIADWSARGHYVYNTLKATAERSQADVRQYLDSRGVPYRSHISLNSLTLAASRSTVDMLAAVPGVRAIRSSYTYEIPRPVFEPTPEALQELSWGIQRVQATRVWTDTGVTGEGIVVANIDTGVEYTHTALVEQYRGYDAGSYDHDYNWYHPTSPTGCDGSANPCDNDGHGTHTMGTIAGSDDPTNPISATNIIGMAPGARWIACKGCEFNSCSSEALLGCADWILAPCPLGVAPGDPSCDPAMRPHVVNNSWGGGPNDGWYFGAVAAWRAAGIFPAFSAGNSGSECNTVNSPSDYYNVFASGAVDINNNIAGFSSRGPSDLGLMKPEVTAPGVAVRSSIPGNDYGTASGTSMASPHSAGELALIWSAQPELIGQVQLTEWLMMQTADPILDDQCGDEGPPNYVYGWGRINAFEAVSTALAYEWDVDWLEVTPDMGTVVVGEAISINVTLDATGLMTGCYTADLKIETNDPYQGLDVLMPVELCVTEPEPPMHYIYLPIAVKND